MQNAKCKMQNAKCKMQNAKFDHYHPLILNFLSSFYLPLSSNS